MAIKKPRVYETFYVRSNTRIRPDQMKFIKAYAKKRKITTADAFRAIIDNFMMNV